jgi:hypothetical protein
MRDRHTVSVRGVTPHHQSGQDDLDDERANHRAGTGRGDRRRGTMLDEKGRRVAVALYQPLADGDPATAAAGRRARRRHRAGGRGEDESLAGVFHDDWGRVTGFWGLAISQMEHRFHAAGGDAL